MYSMVLIAILWFQMCNFQRVYSITRDPDKLHSLRMIYPIMNAVALILIFTHICCSTTNLHCSVVCS